jgi:hypothetical protein
MSNYKRKKENLDSIRNILGDELFIEFIIEILSERNPVSLVIEDIHLMVPLWIKKRRILKK